ncbi:hypothetical protein BRADI_1g52665v3 [Brachypodium distachyon]|uniref:Uncharacterized protein n=1 Tax=Brachypodium distachyon TaxID=15368 RepID=A0A0Q3LAI7_BRADI|nr:hypothetical protein BRADI_1g52665v3 [Brachypodium distachyon]
MALECMMEIFETRENSRNSVTSQVTVDPVRQELKEMMALVVQDGVEPWTDAHFYASQLFMKKEYRDAFSCMEEAKPEVRIEWLKRRWEERKNNN